MILEILSLLLGLAMVVGGANVLIDGSSSLARRFGVSDFVIGLVIIGFGTSLPELVVSVTGALSRNSAIAIGNVVGSNIFNTLLILGLSALFAPVAISRKNKMRDIPIAILATFLVVFLGEFGGLSRVEGWVLLAIFAAYLIYTFRTDEPDSAEASEIKEFPLWASSLLIAGGLACLIFGGNLFVDSAVTLAKLLGVSDKFIAITVLAFGTSMPELVTTVVALSKHRSQMALGNILGSNIFNLLLILGVSAAICPMSFAGIDAIDITALLLSIILVWTGIYTGKKNLLDRFDASVMLLVFVGYMVKLFIAL
ncbi:MAG: calcium/sodium antiporter [Bacteroidales bacterium]|nr:calcium/sodium antiporter [Bacteroidales bacterium]